MNAPEGRADGQGPMCMRLEDGTVAVSWPKGRPREFLISSDLFEDMVQQINEARKARWHFPSLGEMQTTMRSGLAAPVPEAGEAS